MCTLTFARSRSAGGSLDGYSLWFNRDERLTRGPEVPPSTAVTASGVRYVAPTDTDAGGTWIAANEFGVTVCLLNGYIESKGPARPSYVSRGALVRSLADLQRVGDLWRRLGPAKLAPFQPAVIVVVDAAGEARAVRWDGLTAVVSPDAWAELPFVSSSYEQSAVTVARRAIYADLVAEPRNPSAADLDRFQCYVDPALGATENTPSMARSDAATRSQVRVDVTPSRVLVRYAAGPPHTTALEDAVALARGARA